MISPAQCRAARGLLDWSQQDLAREAEVGVVTIRQLEAGVIQPRRATLVVVRHTLEAAGVEFIEDNGGGVGVRFREARRETAAGMNSGGPVRSPWSIPRMETQLSLRP